jgi:excisionase family DNA binding protein
MVLSISQAAEVLNISEISIRRLVKDGRIQHRRIGDRILFTEADIDAFLESVKVCLVQGREAVNA